MTSRTIPRISPRQAVRPGLFTLAVLLGPAALAPMAACHRRAAGTCAEDIDCAAGFDCRAGRCVARERLRFDSPSLSPSPPPGPFPAASGASSVAAPELAAPARGDAAAPDDALNPDTELPFPRPRPRPPRRKGDDAPPTLPPLPAPLPPGAPPLRPPMWQQRLKNS